MVKLRKTKVTPGKPKRRANIGELKRRVEQFERRLLHGHNSLRKLVNEVVLPRLNQVGTQLSSLNTIFARHVVILEILQQRSGGITNAEFEATKKHLFDSATKNTEGDSVRSKEAGTDEDRGEHGQPGVLDAEVSGGDTEGGGSSEAPDSEGRQEESPGTTDSEHPASSAGEDKAC